MYKIYMYTNMITGLIYIGQTSQTLEERAQLNGSNYKTCPRFWQAIQHDGWENFVPEILKDNIKTADSANYWEEYYIRLYNSTNKNIGYNIMSGGNNHEMPAELRERISQAAKERYKDPTKNPMYGKKHSEESLRKMREAKLGEKNPYYGKHLSEESKQKMRETKIKNGTLGAHHIMTEEEREIAVERMRLLGKKRSKKVRCIEDNLEFDSITIAADYYHVSMSTLNGHLKGRQHTCCNKHFEYIE